MVSVIIPTYKRKVEYLLRAINSIKDQTYKNIEIVIIDDNEQNSAYRYEVMSLMTQFENDTNVKYIKNPKNMGGSLARNVGINVSRGEYITFLDDDDEYLPDKVEKQVEFMIKNNCDMSFTDLKLVNTNKEVVDYREYNNLELTDNKKILKYHILRHITGTSTFMYRAEKLKVIKGFDDAKMGQEFYLMLKSIENELKICYLNKCDVIAYRHTDGGISQGKNKINGEKALFDFKKKYFPILTEHEKRFVRFRHYAVMTVAYMRNKENINSIKSAILMVLISPLDFVREFTKYVFNRTKYK
jgi:glycosyltransferase involved in cell wall biosynthesis